VRTPSRSLPPATDTAMARHTRADLDAHPGRSGFRLLARSTNALMSRLVLADQASRSIDLQYYIYANDATGRLFSQRLLAAADRGVRVRVLLDDLDAGDEDGLLEGLDAHPNIEVRLFNPFPFQASSLMGKAWQFLFAARRLNRRMHNKSFIVDGVQAIIGGRNIGDAYFDAGKERHFRDLDVLFIGPIVAQAARSFDAYWNSPAAYPVRAYAGEQASAHDLARLREALTHDARAFSESDYAQMVAEELPDGSSAEQRGGWLWGEARLIADAPEKADPDTEGGGRIAHAVRAALASARKRAIIISPYFIPGAHGEQLLDRLAAKGVELAVLTNSLAASDEPTVHAGYLAYRPALLRAGIDLYEFRPIGGENAAHARGKSSGLSLHAKAMVIDRRKVYIGSMNFDPRSRTLNTEMGVIVDSPSLAAAVEDFFASASAPEHAFHVEPGHCPDRTGPHGRMRWTAVEDGRRVCYERDPEVSAWKRVELQFWRILPLEALL